MNGSDGLEGDNAMWLNSRMEFLTHIPHSSALFDIDEYILNVKETTDWPERNGEVLSSRICEMKTTLAQRGRTMRL